MHPSNRAPKAGKRVVDLNEAAAAQNIAKLFSAVHALEVTAIVGQRSALQEEKSRKRAGGTFKAGAHAGIRADS